MKRALCLLAGLMLATPALAATPVDPTDPNAVQAAKKTGEPVTAKPLTEQSGTVTANGKTKTVEKHVPGSSPVDPTDPNAVHAAKAATAPPN